MPLPFAFARASPILARTPMSAPNPTPAPAPALPWRTRLAYGSGGLLDQWGIFGTKSTANVVFNVVLGVSPATIGIVLAIARLWDAFADPLMGSVSDNARTRWGRRKPFIVAGAVLCGLTFPLVWMMPPGLGPGGQFTWLLVTFLVFYCAFTLFTVPYHAMAYELAPGYHEKTSLLAVRTFIAQTVSIAMAWTFPLIQAGWLGDPVTSVHRLGWIVGAVILVSGVLPGLLIPAETAAVAARPAALPLREALRLAFHSRLLLLVLGIAAISLVGLNMVNLLGNYVTIYYVFGGDPKAAAGLVALSGSLWALLSMLLSPAVAWLSRRIGKRDAFLSLLGCALVATLSKWWLYTPAHPYWQLGVIVLITPGTLALWMISESMVADVCEHDRLRTGLRTEGIYSAMFAWLLKGGIAIALLIANLILEVTGFDVSKGPHQSAETLTWLRALFAFLPAGAILVSMALLLRYPLDEAAMRTVQAKLQDQAPAP
jgi:GPH family glycoside/pentoside/hexuronide:cation symporter